MDLEDLNRRITRLEDLEAIKQLKATYCDICDDAHNPDRIVQIFTEDGIWEGKGIGRAEGHAELRTLFEGFRDAILFSQHMSQNPVIEVNGDVAEGTWYFFGPFTLRKNNRAIWQACRYHDTYRKTPDGWKIAHLRIRGPRLNATYKDGWAD